MKLIIILISFLTIGTLIQGQNTASAGKGKQVNLTKMGFYENKGQITDQSGKPNPTVKYLLSSPGFNVQLKQTGFSYDTYTVTFDSSKNAKNKMPGLKGKLQQPERFIRHNHRVDIELVGCNTHAQLTAENKSEAYYNYVTSGVTQGGVREVHYYSRVIYKNIYPHIDLEFMTSDKRIPVEYNFIVHAGGNPADIKLSYKGATKVNLKDNNLVVSVAAGDFSESIPSSYLKDSKQPVKVTYTTLGNNTFSFSVPNSPIPNSSDLVIDPTPNLAWGTYFGGTNYEDGYGIVLDASSNVYTTGLTRSATGIATSGAYQTTFGGSQNVFVAKYNSTGALLWGTYYGGASSDQGQAITLDASDNIYITGQTTSTSGIATAGAYQTDLEGGSQDVFIAKFTPAGFLTWGTYYGGSGIVLYYNASYGQAITLDASDNIYITGCTSTLGIATAGAYQTTFGGYTGAFVAKFNSTGSALLWGTYYGPTNSSSDYCCGNGIALDASGDIYVAGTTADATGIATTGAYQTTFGGYYDAFVAKFNPTGSALLWGTYYGGTGEDQCTGIALDASGNAYITGNTTTTTGMTTAGAYLTTYVGNNNWHGFIAEFNSTGTNLDWGTYYGDGTGTDGGNAITLDASDNIYITGYTQSTAGIATAGAYQTALTANATKGGNNAFVSKFNSSGTTLLWGTYYGGTGTVNDEGDGIALDACGNVYITGETNSSSGIATIGAPQTTLGGNYDALVAKFSPLAVTGNVITDILCNASNSGSASAIISGETSPFTYSWSPSGGSADTATGLTAGTYTITVKDNCGSSVTASVTISQSSSGLSPTASVITNITCSGESNGNASVNTLGGTTPYTYSWSNGTSDVSTSNPTGAILSAGTYTVTVTDKNGCTGSASVTVTQPTALSTTASVTANVSCNGSSNGNASASPSNGVSPYTYSWSNGSTSNPTGTVLSAGTYTITVHDNCGGSATASVTITEPTALSTTASVTTNVSCNEGNNGSASASPSGGTSPYTYSWSPSGGINSTASNLTAGTYTVTATDKNGCNASASATITQPTALIVAAASGPSACAGQPDTLTSTVSGGTTPYTYSWTPSGGNDSTSIVTPVNNTTYTLTVTDFNGCTNSASVTITVPPVPIPMVSGTQTTCMGTPVTLSASGGATYSWSNGGTTSSITVNPPSNEVYTVTVANGSCTARDSVRVIVKQEPSGAACCSASIKMGENTTLNITPTDMTNSYNWTPQTGLSCTNCPNPVASPTVTTIYYVTITDSDGCTERDSLTITVSENCGTVFIPNVFSPNNDGQNDVLYVMGNCIENMDFIIYDRWGNKVFESTDQSTGWNGTYKGQPAGIGTYVYYFSGTTINNQIITKKGTVTLVR